VGWELQLQSGHLHLHLASYFLLLQLQIRWIIETMRVRGPNPHGQPITIALSTIIMGRHGDMDHDPHNGGHMVDGFTLVRSLSCAVLLTLTLSSTSPNPSQRQGRALAPPGPRPPPGVAGPMPCIHTTSFNFEELPILVSTSGRHPPPAVITITRAPYRGAQCPLCNLLEDLGFLFVFWIIHGGNHSAVHQGLR